MGGGDKRGGAARRPGWGWAVVPLVASVAAAFSLAVWAGLFSVVLGLKGGQLGTWPAFACGLLVGMRVASVWRRAAGLGREWHSRLGGRGPAEPAAAPDRAGG